MTVTPTVHFIWSYIFFYIMFHLSYFFSQNRITLITGMVSYFTLRNRLKTFLMSQGYSEVELSYF